MKKLAPAAIVAIVAIAAATYFLTRDNRDPARSIRISGNVEVTSVALSFKVPGRVRERLVDEGEAVSPGQPVAVLESVDLAHEVAIRKAETETARAALRELQSGSRKEEIAQAEASLAASEAEAVRLSEDFRRQKELYSREVIPRQKFDAARAARDVSQAQLRQARESLALTRKGPRTERIQQAEARLRQTEAALALSRERFGYATLTAPTGGVVLAKNVEPGEQVAAGTPVVTIGRLDNVWVRGYIAETDLGRVRLGQKAKVTTDTWPGKSYDGTLSFISSEAEFTPKNVQTQKERVKLVYRVKITLPNPDGELKPGMPADAEILLK